MKYHSSKLKKKCSERSQDLLHMRILLLVRYSQWTRTCTRTVTKLPTVKGFMTKWNA